MRMYPKQLPQLVRLAINIMVQPKPVPLKHDFHDREDDLRHCKVCNGAEASLTYECPGERVRPTTEELVLEGRLDFFNGTWNHIPLPVKENYDHSDASLLALRDKQAYLQSLSGPSWLMENGASVTFKG